MCVLHAGKNLPFILKLLEKVPLERSHRLGIELDIPVYLLNVIEVDYKNDSERIREEIVQKWLEGNRNISLEYLEKVANKLCKLRT